MIVLIILHSIPHVYKKILNAPAEPIVLPSRDTSHTLVQILLLHRRQHCREGKKASMRFNITCVSIIIFRADIPSSESMTIPSSNSTERTSM